MASMHGATSWAGVAVALALVLAAGCGKSAEPAVSEMGEAASGAELPCEGTCREVREREPPSGNGALPAGMAAEGEGPRTDTVDE